LHYFTFMKKRTNNQKRRSPKKRNNRRPGQTVPKPLARFAPVTTANHQDTWLTYQHLGVLNNPGGTAASKFWDVNCAYDVDPALGSTATAGFAEWGFLYRYYRVLKFQVFLEISTIDGNPMSLVMGIFNLTPPGSTVQYDQYLGNPWFRRKLISPTSSGRPVASFRTPVIDCANLVGDRNIFSDPNFASTTISVPSNKLFWGFSITPATGATLANGVTYSISIRMATRFSERNVLDQ
jgi:hypothetical protein